MSSPTQLSLLDAVSRRETGLDRVECNNRAWVDDMRRAARVIAHQNGTVTSDDLRAYADRRDKHPTHSNTWGSVFRGAEWEQVGFQKSQYASNNARRISVWRLRK